jgi:uncharacterized damage-inducible protein DinB
MLKQYDYHVWATGRVCGHLKELPEEACRTELQSVFPTVYDVLVHQYVIDHGWLDALSGPELTEMSPEYVERLKASIDRLVAETKGKSIGELEGMMTELYDRFRVFLSGLDDVEAMFTYAGLRASYSDFVQHFVNHGTYHRGNITAMLRQQGYAGIPTDFGFYLYMRNQ